MNMVTDRIPADVCSVLMDLAQGFDGVVNIDYTDIMDWSDKASKEEIVELRRLISDLADLDYAFDDDEDAREIANKITEMIKG